MELRMFFLVMYNLSPIQQGIQAGHCALRYSRKYKDDETFGDFVDNYETFVLLNGGTSNSGFIQEREIVYKDGTVDIKGVYDELAKGSMEMHEKYLIENKIPFTAFREPDANKSLTALCFICDERVFKMKEYPPFKDWIKDNVEFMITPEFNDPDLEMFLDTEEPPYNHPKLNDLYIKWVEFIGGAENVAKKNLIQGKKLA